MGADTLIDLEPTRTQPAPVARPTAAKPKRYEGLDTWRGLCCLMLVVFHATMQVTWNYFGDQQGTVHDAGSLGMWLASKLWVGVPIFFVISGYCIMATLHARRDKGGVVEFAKRRFWRIYPPYYAALALAAVAIYFGNQRWPGLFHDGVFTIQNPTEMSAGEWVGNLTLTESWRHCVFGGESAHLLPNTWTLCYEEQFYVVAALILVFASRRIFTAAIAVTAFVVAGKLLATKLGWNVRGSIFDGGWLQILAGIVLYYRVNFATARQIRWIHAGLLVGILISLRNPTHLTQLEPHGDLERLTAFGFALFASLAYPLDQKWSRSGWLKPLRLVGAMSYSVYLCHPLVAKGISHAFFRAGVTGNLETLVAVLPLCVIASLVVAYVFHRLIERHFIPPTSIKKPIVHTAA